MRGAHEGDPNPVQLLFLWRREPLTHRDCYGTTEAEAETEILW